MTINIYDLKNFDFKLIICQTLFSNFKRNMTKRAEFNTFI